MASHEPAAPSWWDRLCADPGRDVRLSPNRGDAALAVCSTRRSSLADAGRGGWQDSARFALEWLRDPAGTAAVAPSGKALAALITREIDASSGAVLELGPGTGVFTARLLSRGVQESDLTLVEQNSGFARLLGQRFPRATILDIDAAALGHGREGESPLFGAVVCGLGLRNMPPAQVEAIVRAAFARMAPGAAFYLFTYGRRCSVPADVLEEIGLVAEHVGTALRNVPPASVYRLTRFAPAR
jgi:phosphatidylethanolamine/phosphatidyl-N-methylethanolamine N-methyltransferase